MAPGARKVVDAAMKLPVRERAQVVAELLSSLDGDHDEDPAAVEAAWAKEIRKRLDDIDSGKVQALSWDEAQKIIDADE